MVINWPTLRRHVPALICGAFCIGVLSACTTSQNISPDEPDVTVNHLEAPQDDIDTDDTMAEVRNTLRAGLKGIFQRYINPVSLDELAL